MIKFQFLGLYYNLKFLFLNFRGFVFHMHCHTDTRLCIFLSGHRQFETRLGPILTIVSPTSSQIQYPLFYFIWYKTKQIIEYCPSYLLHSIKVI